MSNVNAHFEQKPINWNLIRKISFGLCYVFLAVSMYQASWFMWSTSEEGFQRFAMISTVVGLIAFAHICAFKFGLAHAAGVGWLAFMTIFIIVPIEGISMYTSASALNSRVFSAIQRENTESEAYKSLMSIAEKRQELSNAATERMTNTPLTFSTQGRKIGEQASSELDKAQAAVSDANAVNVSPTAKAYAALENSTGITPVMIQNAIAVFLSIGPLFVAIFWTVMSGGIPRIQLKRGEPSGKKPQRPDSIRAVS